MVSITCRVVVVVIVLFFAWVSPNAAASDPADWRTVVQTDGEVRTGKLERLIDGRMQITGPAGEWLIEADKIAAVYAFLPADEAKSPGQPVEIEVGVQTTLALSAATSHANALMWGLSAQAAYQVTDWFLAGIRTGIQTGFEDQDTTLFDLAGIVTFQFGSTMRFYLEPMVGGEVVSFGSAVASGGIFGASVGTKLPISRRAAMDIGATYAYSLLNVTVSSEQLDDYGVGDVSGTFSGHRLFFRLGVLLYF